MKAFHYSLALLVLVSESAFSGQVKTEGEAIRLATNAIHKFNLTPLRDECGAIAVIERSAYFEIVVHERHTPQCGGTPETAPRLFSVRVRKKDGRLTSDVYDGTNYRPVDHKLVQEK